MHSSLSRRCGPTGRGLGEFVSTAEFPRAPVRGGDRGGPKLELKQGGNQTAEVFCSICADILDGCLVAVLVRKMFRHLLL